MKLDAVIFYEPVIRGNPEKSERILRHSFYNIARQSILYAVFMKTVLLPMYYAREQATYYQQTIPHYLQDER
jgi:hypothetical protein